MNQIAVIDSAWSGHVPTYHVLIVQALLEQGLIVTSYSPRPVEVQQWISRHAPEISGNLTCRFFNEGQHHESVSAGKQPPHSCHPAFKRLIKKIPLIENVYRYRTAIRQWQQIAANAAMLPGTPVFIPYLDYGYLHPLLTPQKIDSILNTRWSGLFLHPKYLRLPESGAGKRKAGAIFAARNCSSVAALDEGVSQQLEKQIGKQVVVFPDITDIECDHLSTTATEAARKANGRIIVSLTGYLSSKKNLTTLLRAVERLDSSRFYFIVAGELDCDSWSRDEAQYILTSLLAAPENLYFISCKIPDGIEYNSLVKISDVLFAMYANFLHSSNTLTKAAVFRKPVIVSDGYLMAERVRKYRLGKVVPQGDVNGCISAIEKLAGEISDGSIIETAMWSSYYENHSYEALKRAILQITDSYEVKFRINLE